jgi:hypothetical protein
MNSEPIGLRHKVLQNNELRTLIDNPGELFELMLKHPLHDFQKKHFDLQNTRTPNTGEWIFRHPKFQAWTERGDFYGKQPTSNTLWCKGNGNYQCNLSLTIQSRLWEDHSYV